MKTKNVIVSQSEIKKSEIEKKVIDREFYIPEIIKKITENKNTIVIEIYGGCLSDVHNIPENYNYDLIDWDDLKECDENEFKKLLKKHNLLRAGE